MEIAIADKLIGKERCFIIAEAGVNHNGDFEMAKKLVDAAKDAGADAVKFQTFKSEEISTAQAGQAKYQIKNTGKCESQLQMLKKLELSYEDFRGLRKYCDERQVIFLSTPHSCKADVDLIAELCAAIKVGSGDLTNIPILKYIAQKQLPIILPTGMADLEETKESVEAILKINQQLILLHCTTNYPTPLKEVNLKAMETLSKEFNLNIGYSDHTDGINVSLAAVAFGACLIEKHFTLDKNLPGPDHKASLNPIELKEMVKGIRLIEQMKSNGESVLDIVSELNVSDAIGDGVKRPNPSELEIAKIARKSIVAARDIRIGETIKEDMLSIKRPGIGIKPKHFDELLGKVAKEDIRKDELISWKMV